MPAEPTEGLAEGARFETESVAPEGFFHPVDALSPIDGRYREKTAELAPIFSERALMTARVQIEIEYLQALSEEPGVPLRRFTIDEEDFLEELRVVSTEDAIRIKEIEATSDHDVKAVEYYLRERLAETTLADEVEWIHFGLTSEDVNNLSYGVMLRRGLETLNEAALGLRNDLHQWADRYADVPMLGRTHGQPATPTTVGKEFKVFATRLDRELTALAEHRFRLKLNGATGNYAAHHHALPEVDWPAFADKFIDRLNQYFHTESFECNPVTTQIEPHDTYAEFFHKLTRVNTILEDFDQDMWRYISDDWIKQRPKAGTVGSSTMPQKVNPINLENAEGSAALSTALCEFFARRLPISRLQRHLSDSTLERYMGQAFALSLMAIKETQKGLAKCEINQGKIAAELAAHPEVLAEAYQTVLRREGIPKGYERFKGFIREKQEEGQVIDLAALHEFIDGIEELSDDQKRELKRLRPEAFTGLAATIAARD